MPRSKTKKFVRKELIREIGRRTGFTQGDILLVFEAMCDIIIEAVAEDKKVIIREFGSFRMTHLKQRRSRNPYSGQELIVPGKNVVKFKPASTFTAKLNPNLGLPMPMVTDEEEDEMDFDDED